MTEQITKVTTPIQEKLAVSCMIVSAMVFGVVAVALLPGVKKQIDKVLAPSGCVAQATIRVPEDCATIQLAINTLPPNPTIAYTILVSPGTHAGFKIENITGTTAAQVTVRGIKNPDGTRGATINSKGPNSRDFIFIGNPAGNVKYINIEGLKVTGNTDRVAIYLLGAEHITIKDNELFNNRDQIHSLNTINFVIEDNLIHDSDTCNSRGVYLTGNNQCEVEGTNCPWAVNPYGRLENVTVRNNAFYNNNTNIQIHAGENGLYPWKNVLVENNRLYKTSKNSSCENPIDDNKGGQGMNLGGWQNSTIRNNLIYDSAWNSIRLFAHSSDYGIIPSLENSIHNNVIINPTDPAIFIGNSCGDYLFNNVILGTGSVISVNNDASCAQPNVDDDIAADGSNIKRQYDEALLRSLFIEPLTADPALRNYHLKDDSPARNSFGIAAFMGKSAPTTDFEADTRPQGTAFDIGADEYREIAPLCTDTDGDSFGIDDGVCTAPFDCDPDDPAIYPGASEICDGVDNQCSGDGFGIVDEGCTSTIFSETFEGFELGSDILPWQGTGAGNSLTPQTGLFSVAQESPTNKALITQSTLTNIHAHYQGTGAGTWSDYVLTGRMKLSSSNNGIGVTLYSDYPTKDNYYSLRRYATSPTFKLFNNHGGTFIGNADTRVNPDPNTWYRFRILADTAGTATIIKAKVWKETGEAEPADWQAFGIYQGSFLTDGTIGAWSKNTTGNTNAWDDFALYEIAAPSGSGGKKTPTVTE